MLQRARTIKGFFLTKQIEKNYWESMFNEADTDGDNRLSINELRDLLLKKSTDKNKCPLYVENIMKLADKDGDDYIDREEFMVMIQKPQLHEVFNFGYRFLDAFVVIPRTGKRVKDGTYERSISCNPFPWFFILMTVIQVGIYTYDYINVGPEGKIENGMLYQMMVYNPYKKNETWRFVTYMFTHTSWFHLAFNMVLQLLVGIPLEMVHKQCRVISLYLYGVIIASLWTTVIQPTTLLSGASGGVYALMTSHVSALILNWSEMETAWIQLIVFAVAIIMNVLNQVYTKYISENAMSNIGYTAHVFGALAGILMGLCLLRNIQVKKWEKKVVLCSSVLCSLLMGAGVVIVIMRD